MTQFVDEDDAGLNDRNCEDGFSILTRGSQLVGHDFPDLVNEESSLIPRAIQLESRGKSWVEFVREARAISLFGSGFGEILKPLAKDPPLCSHWREVPKHRDYLTISVKDLRTSLPIAKSLQFTLPQVDGSGNGSNRSNKLFEGCDCQDGGQHCERGQDLSSTKKTFSSQPVETEVPTCLPEAGGVILGQPDSFAKVAKNLKDHSAQLEKNVLASPTVLTSSRLHR